MGVPVGKTPEGLGNQNSTGVDIIPAQGLGIGEAAYRLGRTYAHTRQQFGVPIERIPAVADMVTAMKVAVEAARALTYETSRLVDIENNANRIIAHAADRLNKAELKQFRQTARTLKRVNSMLTPMSKYYSSEMCCRVASTTIQVLGGSGYMRDYPAERYFRDARITTIYEGTSQLQIVAAIKGVTSGTFESFVADWEKRQYEDGELEEQKRRLIEARETVSDAIQFAKGQSPTFVDLVARQLVDAAIDVIIGHMLLGQATQNQRKKRVLNRFLNDRIPAIHMNCEQVKAGDMSPVQDYELIAGPVPRED